MVYPLPDGRSSIRTALLFACLIPLTAADINPDQYLAHIRYLSSPALKGRATGSPELEKAAHYIAAQFHSFGLQPVELAFPVTLGAHMGPKNRLKFTDGGESRTLAQAKDFLPMSFSSSGDLHAAVASPASESPTRRKITTTTTASTSPGNSF